MNADEKAAFLKDNTKSITNAIEQDPSPPGDYVAFYRAPNPAPEPAADLLVGHAEHLQEFWSQHGDEAVAATPYSGPTTTVERDSSGQVVAVRTIWPTAGGGAA